MDTSAYPLVSIISINYNQSKTTLEFLKSIENITYPNYEVIIVDNASPNDHPEIIKEQYPSVHLVFSKQNLGFAGGNNLGILHSNGDYLLFINNDTEVEPDFLEPLVQAFKEDDTLGLVSPKIIFYHHKQEKLLQYAGGTAVNYLKGTGHFLGYGETDTGKYQTSHTELIHGAAVMVPRKLVKKISVWPDIYFLYYEEIDWSEHFKRSGYKLKFIAESVIYHKESLSIGKFTPIRIYYMNRNRQLFIRRNASFLNKILSLLYFYFVSIPKSTLYFLLKFRFDLLNALWKGIFWNLFHWFNINLNPILSETDTKKTIINSFIKYPEV